MSEWHTVCWKCHKILDARVDKKCAKCGWYICSECHECKPNCAVKELLAFKKELRVRFKELMRIADVFSLSLPCGLIIEMEEVWTEDQYIKLKKKHSIFFDSCKRFYIAEKRFWETLASGQVVEHKKMGEGRVIRIDGGKFIVSIRGQEMDFKFGNTRAWYVDRKNRF